MAPSEDAGGSPDRLDASPDPSPLGDLDLWLLFAVTLVGVGNVSGVSPAFPRVLEVLRRILESERGRGILTTAGRGSAGAFSQNKSLIRI
jgi:hypothetical protein